MICDHRHFKFLPFLSQNLFACMLASCDSLSLSFIFFNLRGIPSLTMSSFLPDSAIGMGGSDFGGLIQQPLMDREVISVGGSSSEDTRHDASNNESSSLKRLRVSRRIGGGTSCLHGRVQSSAASSIGEPIPITVILPPPLLLKGKQGRMVAGTLRHFLMCDVAIVLGRHRPSLPLLALSG